MIVTFERDIKNELIQLEKEITTSLKTDFSISKKSKRDAFTKVLSHIADILYKTSLKHDEWHHKRKDNKQFAFFPGYVDNNDKRIFNIAYINEKDNNLSVISKFNYNFYVKINEEKKKDKNFDIDTSFNELLKSKISIYKTFKEKEINTDKIIKKEFNELKSKHFVDYEFYKEYNNKDEKEVIRLLTEISKQNQLIYKNFVKKNYKKFNLDFWYNHEKHNSLTYKNSLEKSKQINILSLAYHFLFLGKTKVQEIEERLKILHVKKAKLTIEKNENSDLNETKKINKEIDLINTEETELKNNESINKNEKIKIEKKLNDFINDNKYQNYKPPTFSHEIGGTHQWASQVADEIAINDALDPLTLLAFYDNKKDARDNQLKYKSWINIPFDLKGAESEEVRRINDLTNNKIIEKTKVKLIQEEIYNWCESVVNKLDFPSNTKEVNKVKEKWPYNPNCSHDDKYFLIYRAYIVAFWMQFVLRPERFLLIRDKALIGKLPVNIDELSEDVIKNLKGISSDDNIKLTIKEIDDFKENLKKQKLESDAWFGFTDYIYSIKTGEVDHQEKDLIVGDYEKYTNNFEFRKERLLFLKSLIEYSKNNEKTGEEQTNYERIIVHNYNYWYTIPFKHRLDFSSNNVDDSGENERDSRKETGSAMLLTNYLLDGEYFRFIIPWLNQMYNALREYDTAKEASGKAFADLLLKISKGMTRENIIALVKEFVANSNTNPPTK